MLHWLVERDKWNVKHMCEKRGVHGKRLLGYYKGEDNLGDQEVDGLQFKWVKEVVKVWIDGNH